MENNNTEEFKEFDVAKTDDQLDAFLFEEVAPNNEPLFGVPKIEDFDTDVQFGKKPNLQTVDDINGVNALEHEVEDLSPELLLISQLLESKGIKDGLIKIAEEDGTEVDVPFKDLTPEEQLNILNANVNEAPELSESESQAVEFLRTNGVTLEQTVDYYVKQAILDYEKQKIGTSEDSIESLTDEEVYVYDMMVKYKDLNLTEEQIQIELDKQREHPDLFKQKTDILRNEYLQLEKDELTNREKALTAAEEAKAKQTQTELVGAAKELLNIGGIDIEDADKQEILQVILTKDVNGEAEFDKLLKDPKQKLEMAWYAKKGKEAFDVLHDYYKKEIAEASKKGYEKGKAEATPAESTQVKSTNLRSIIKPKPNKPLNLPSNNYPDADIFLDDLLKK